MNEIAMFMWHFSYFLPKILTFSPAFTIIIAKFWR